MTIKELRDSPFLLLDCVSGSHAYGLQHAESDIDRKGVFIQPQSYCYGLNKLEQINDERNDEVYYELGKFLYLLERNNPNILELLFTPSDCVLFRHPILDRIQASAFLSKRCFHSFAGYALSQIKKARGLNKKIVNPMAKERKSVLEFCFVTFGQGALPLRQFLARNNWKQEHCGLVNIPHMKDLYALFYDPNGDYKGIVRKENANEVCLSSIPKGAQAIASLYFNKDGYSVYCKEYHAYWQWVADRNESRYRSNLAHGQSYDTKNMMHTFRLLAMAEEIATTKTVQVRRTRDRDFLWSIRQGAYSYEALLEMAEGCIERIGEAFEGSDLREQPEAAEGVLVEMRREWYGGEGGFWDWGH